MLHYVPIPTATGYAVAYGNHRDEFVPVLECPTFEIAYRESARMTLDGIHKAAAVAAVQGGNAYLQKYINKGQA